MPHAVDGTNRTASAAGTAEARTASIVLPGRRFLHARIWPGQGTPIVALHGLLDCSQGWADLCRAVPNPSLAVDLPGFGRSDLPTRPRFSAYADDVAHALELLGVDRFVLVGHSLGGGVATAVAERLPDRVAGLVLLAPVGFGRLPLAEAVSLPGVRGIAERLMPYALRSSMAMNVLYGSIVTNGQAMDRELRGRVTADSGRLIAAAGEAARAVAAGGASKRGFHRREIAYGGPVTVLWGDADRVVPVAHLAGVRAALPQARTLVWEGMGHHPQRERPDALLELIAGICGIPATSRRGATQPLRLAKAA